MPKTALTHRLALTDPAKLVKLDQLAADVTYLYGAIGARALASALDVFSRNPGAACAVSKRFAKDEAARAARRAKAAPRPKKA